MTATPAGRPGATTGLEDGAAVLALAVLTDSMLEHYRAGWYHRAMYAAPLASAVTLGAAVGGRRATGRSVRTAAYVLGGTAGLAGASFHARNVLRRGGVEWRNLFHGAPAAAPLAVSMAAVLGLLSQQRHLTAGRRAGLVALVCGGLAGSSGEAWLFHFRGAFQNPVMYLPVVVPPAAGVALVVATLRRGPWIGRARTLLGVTAIIGLAGIGFHAYGVHRRMGGWCNAWQNILSGPPLPAPLAFAGLALAGLAAIGWPAPEPAAHARSRNHARDTCR